MHTKKQVPELKKERLNYNFQELVYVYNEAIENLIVVQKYSKFYITLFYTTITSIHHVRLLRSKFEFI